MRRGQPWCRSSCTLIPVWCSGNCRNCARASCTSWCGDTRGLCAQRWSGLCDECTRLSFVWRGVVLWTDPPASVSTPVANCWYLHAGCCRTVCMGWCKTSGKVHGSFGIRTVWSVCTAVCTVRRMDARQMHAAVGFGCNGSHGIVATLR